ncbi:MAG: sulfatase-like hydrolase/transferase [Ilumatobacter sp.]|nr:sulfatase-like hydrolase/transferase [Ilumatobacter sp.]
MTAPNIVFMLADNVGSGDLSCFGGNTPTPRLDELAGEGIRFTNFNTEAQCTPTRGAILTGRMPVRTGTFRVPLPGEPGDYGLSTWEYTLADLLSDAGYATACYGKWHLGDVAGRLPTDQGFDEWWGITESSDEAAYTAHRLYPDEWHVPQIKQATRGEQEQNVADFDLETRPLMDEGITERTVGFIKRNAESGQPFFAYVPFTNLHPPMIPHPDFDNGQGDYAANVAELDARAGQILDALEEAGVAENTIVVWASDNAAGAGFGGSNAPWRGWFGGGWEGSIRAPAMIRWPGHVPSDVVSDQIVATYDWFPTLATLAGETARIPDDRPIDGIDMAEFMTGGRDESGREHFVFLGSDAEPLSVKWKDLKVHFREATTDAWSSPLVSHQIPAVYDLADDPGEQNDLMVSELTLGWAVRAAMMPMIELQQSAAQYPHISPGAEFGGYS